MSRLGMSVMASEFIFDVRFDQWQGDRLPGGWSYYGTGSRMQFQDGNLVFTNDDPKRESGIVTRFEVKKGFDYEFTVELVEAIPGEKPEGVFLLLSTADGQTRQSLAKSPVASGGLGQYQGPPEQMVFMGRPDSSSIKNDAAYIVSYQPSGGPGEMRDYTIYLPMYARLESLHISLSPASARIEPPTPYKLDKPVVWYSTSFAQGSGSSGPSMSFPALTCRLLGVDLVNYGISGNREWKPEEAEMLSEIPAAVYIMGPILGDVQSMKVRYPKMVEILRQRHPDTPILLVTRLHTIGVTKPHEVNALVRQLYENRLAAGDKNLHFLDVFNLYSDGAIPYTIDGVHVTDLGAKIIADAFLPTLKQILGTAGARNHPSPP